MAKNDQFNPRDSLSGVVGEGRESPEDSPLSHSSSEGAQPSNTAPANSISTSSTAHVLRSGVDSLYVSFPGDLSTEVAKELESLKEIAQLPAPEERLGAVMVLNGHQFEVRDRGKGRFPYVLVDNWFHLQVSGEDAGQLPLVYAQIRSELLTCAGWEASLSDLAQVVQDLDGYEGEPAISRVDLCADFTTALNVDEFPLETWVARPKQKSSYYSADKFTGHAFGLGGDMSARLYDKTEELKKSRKFYLEPIWRDAGWDGEETVWRLEFQFKRSVLKELGVESAEDLEFHMADLWRYATKEWLRFTVPNPNDTTRSRWKNHPLWNDLTNVGWDWDSGENLERVPKTREPNDHYLFKHGLSGITSYMASKGIEDFYDGLVAFINDAVDYHRIMGRETGESLESYTRSKVLDKVRRYNTTLITPSPDPAVETKGGGS